MKLYTSYLYTGRDLQLTAQHCFFSSSSFSLDEENDDAVESEERVGYVLFRFVRAFSSSSSFDLLLLLFLLFSTICSIDRISSRTSSSSLTSGSSLRFLTKVFPDDDAAFTSSLSKVNNNFFRLFLFLSSRMAFSTVASKRL